MKQLEILDFINAIHDGIAITDGNGKFLTVNKSYESLMGLKAEEVVGQTVDSFVKERIISQSVTLDVLEQKEPCTILQNVYKTNKSLLISATPLFKGKEITHVISILRDMTELINLKQQIEKTRIEKNRMQLELERLRMENQIQNNYIFESPKMKKIVQMIMQISELDSTVLITGESGVGKEIIARLIHDTSKFKKGNFVAVNCGAIPENLIESEFFGYDEGAFTGAVKKGKPGFFELADEGTLFLDEIGELPLNLQVKLLRVIQEKSVTRLGGKSPKRINFRLLAATNRNLNEMVSKNLFRLDLYYRLNVVPIEIPPLRSRKEDIPKLIDFFTKKFNERYKQNKVISPHLVDQMVLMDWPGNIRELENTIERLIATTIDAIITTIYPLTFSTSHSDGYVVPLKEFIELKEKEYLEKLYSNYQSTRKLAKALDCDQSTIVRKLNKYGISKLSV